MHTQNTRAQASRRHHENYYYASAALLPTHAVPAFGGVGDYVVVHQDRRVVDVEIVAAAPDDDHRRDPQLQPQRAHPVDELFIGTGVCVQQGSGQE